jgi:hypothetical protein
VAIQGRPEESRQWPAGLCFSHRQKARSPFASARLLLSNQGLVVIGSIAVIGLVIWGLSEMKKSSFGSLVEQARSALAVHNIRIYSLQEMLDRELHRR